MSAAETIEAKSTAQQRSLTIDLFCPGETTEAKHATLQRMRQSIRHYRATLRQCFSALAMAQMAGADVGWTGDGDDADVRVTPNNDAARAILAHAFGHDGKALGYQLRTHVLQTLAPSWLSFVWDSLRRDMATAWTAKDPEFTRAGRGWLVLQGSRNLSQFNRRGIGHPLATARPKLNGHTLTLKWDREIGPVEFQLPRMDGGRYAIWRALRDGDDGWQLGTVYLNERDGLPLATMTYSKPATFAETDGGRVCRVVVDPSMGTSTLFGIGGPDGVLTTDAIDSCEVRAWLAQQMQRRQALEARRAACGNPKRPWGHRKGWLAAQDVLSRQTLQRERGLTDRNHAWTRRIATRAASWRCGVVEITGIPNDGQLGGLPWNWTQFRTYLSYKCGERGITLRVL